MEGNMTNTDWTNEHEEAKKHFMETYITFPPLEPSWERQQLKELVWEKAYREGQLVFVPASTERKAHFRLKEVIRG